MSTKQFAKELPATTKPLSNNKHEEFTTQQVESTASPKRSSDISPTCHRRTNASYDFEHSFKVNLELDFITIILFVLAIVTRFYRFGHPNNIVFDELHYGKFIGHYVENMFFFDFHPPFGKQLIAAVSYATGFRSNTNYTFTHIGKEYSEDVPIFWFRFVPALCGSLLVPCIYKLLLQLQLNRWTAVLGGLLIMFDNALLTQSRFVLMEPILIFFSMVGFLFLLKFDKHSRLHISNDVGYEMTNKMAAWLYACLAAIFFTLAICTKFVGIYSAALAIGIVCQQFWKHLTDTTLANMWIVIRGVSRCLVFGLIPFFIYVSIFWIHLALLHRAGPHDMVMTSAFQASLDGGLASITKNQPLVVSRGSQITLRHTLGRTCWLHSHAHVYPVRYPDKRGSSHQQQVTCYSFKDVNNWWIVKRADVNDLVVDTVDGIQHGDDVEFIHGITSRALNSHDVAAPMTPQSQEVTCYVDYNISMAAHTVWTVDIINREQEGSVWHAIKSRVRLVHKHTGFALRMSGRQLPDWGFNQHEVVTDRNVEQDDTIWNVEEHRYTKTEDQRERERQLLNSEMIPTERTSLTFIEKLIELQQKIFWHNPVSGTTKNHMYASYPLEWPLMDKGIAYWIDQKSNAQIHLIGNLLIWYSGTAAIFIYVGLLVFYLLRRRRSCYDIPDALWMNYVRAGTICGLGYLFNFLPYFLIDRPMFLHNYLPALVFKILLLCVVVEHMDKVMIVMKLNVIVTLYRISLALWLTCILYVFFKFSALTYGNWIGSNDVVSASNILDLQWKNTWDFILHL